jgi:hypothetical protein
MRIYCADLGEPGTGKHGARDMDFNASQEFKSANQPISRLAPGYPLQADLSRTAARA